MSSNDPLIRNSLRSASSLIGLQLFSRLFTFVLNQAMVRVVPPRAYGTAAVQFELLLSTILFLSREGVRNSLLRVKKANTATHNISVLPTLLGFPVAITAAYSYARFAGLEVRSQEYFTTSIKIYAVAALLELMSEPMHNLAMSELKTGIRVKAEGFGITSKTVVTFLILLYDLRSGMKGDLALLAFAGGQLAYGSVVLITYASAYGIAPLWPSSPPIRDNNAHYFDPETLRLSLTMTYQSVIKHFLTEGDKLILSWFSPLQDQGGYAIAVNYGSLIARIVFQPIEEASRGFFSKILSRGSVDADQYALTQAATFLTSLVSVQIAFSIIFLVFGVAYIPVFLQILLPRQYLTTSAPKVLSAWVWYIPVLALNGGLEAFLSSVATPQDLINQSRWMATFSAAYIAAAIALFSLNVGDASLVYANILNLSVRIVYTARFVSLFFARQSTRQVLKWKTVLPGIRFSLLAILSVVFVRISHRRLGIETMIREERLRVMDPSVLLHVGIGAALCVSNLGLWWMEYGRHLSITHSQHPKKA